jgi:flagellar basal-body rod protein FlgB
MSMIDDPSINWLARVLDLSAMRSELVMSNMANIDTPGYRTRDIDFRQELERADGDLQYASFAPAVHLVQGLVERPDGNNVSLEREGLLLADTQLRFNAAVQLLRDTFQGLNSAIHEGSSS